ncbi:ATP-dependent Clp protease proteolytic subunit 3, chloroplastic-like [Vicia villosa]|uniref:ATP-dependent Clp protease proteolytic subunit 3, chloroplastic-like n=1 Tax=Vicia villosa TaxID=3911 RepID=UPI00273B0D7C|nr:ATP-dependent Clp protease proteolytic subunit 3, chloroplastic-like [Vicia villosa]
MEVSLSSTCIPLSFKSNNTFLKHNNYVSHSQIPTLNLSTKHRTTICNAIKPTLSSNWLVSHDLSAKTASPWLPNFEELDTTNMLLRQRIVFLGSQVDDTTADFVISQLLFLDADDPKKDIKLFINCPGGAITAGMGIYDAMKLCKADVSTVCLGLAASMGAFLLAAGTKGKRYCMPNSRVMIHQPLGSVGGTAIEMRIRARELAYHKVKINKILSRITRKPEEQIELDTDRDYFMNAWEAKEYGLIDEVIDDGKPGLVAPIVDATPPPKTKMRNLWEIKEKSKGKKILLPSEEAPTAV